MQKVVFILLLTLFISGCSVLKTAESRNKEISDELTDSKILEDVKKNNVTNNSIYIQKAEIEILSKDVNQKLLGSLKFKSPDKYLLIIRNKAGMEAVRIFVSSDTILINNRINRKFYFGSTDYLTKKYGISPTGLPILLGDFVNENSQGKIKEKCSEGKLIINGIINGSKIIYIIDCKERKVIQFKRGIGFNESLFEIKYGDFIKSDTVIIPGKIEITDAQRMMSIEIKIKKLVFPWDGDVELIPGNKYETIELL
ncbi:MAG: DUF4292 domain-containing protein [Bacteroidales bacterium]|nr:DUF4292 domain-containing protein [Bacteroidales bacterium]